MHDAIGRMSHVVIDCHDPPALAAFWSAVLGTDANVSDPDWATAGDQATGVLVAFQRVPEPKRVKNRLHLDIEVQDVSEAVARGVALGATVVGSAALDAE